MSSVREQQVLDSMDIHIVEFTEDEYALQHPIACRPDLLSCRYQKRLKRESSPMMGPGRYWMDFGGGEYAFWPVT